MTLSPDDERRVLLLVEEAFEQTPNQRAGFLTQRLAGETASLTRAMELLAAGGADSSMNTTELPDIPALHDLEPTPVLLPDNGGRIGAYRIIEPIGQGGMGLVYLAERSDGAFDKRVAIKVVQSHRARDEFAQRFEAERQILANIVHPNIAALLDGGYLDDGSPYLVMEYIEGPKVDEYVFTNALSIDQTLNVFLAICDGVQAAHQSLIVHRDIKPSNILVDEQGHPKLIDFGIAKDLAGVVGEVTQVGGPSALTYDYASPEQYNRARVTTATDVYGLGILLFNLISGCKPYSTSGSTPREVHELIVETPAPTMDRARQHAIISGIDLRIERSHIPQELELIVAKAVAKEPARRYATAQNFADDVRAYLNGQPVEARGDSWAYQSSKFITRHWLGLSAISAVLVAMVAALMISVAQTRAADTAAAHSNATSDFLAKLLLAPSSRADSPLRLGSEAKVSELLAHAAAELKGRGTEKFEGAADVRAELMLTVGRTYHGLAMYPQAIELLQEAQEICLAQDCGRNALAARIDFRLGQSFVLTGKPEEALALFQGAADASGDLLLQARIADETASALWSLGDQAGTVAKMEEAVERYRAAAGDEPDLAVAVSYTRLGSLYSNIGQLERGLTLLRKGARLYEALGQTAVPELADLYNEISIIFWKRGQPEQSHPYLLKAYAVTEAIEGVSEIEIRVVTNIGLDVVRNVGAQAAREWLLKSERALESFASGNAEHEARGWVLRLEGMILADEQRYEEALAVFRNELAIYQNLMPAYNDSHAGTETVIGGALEKLGRLKEALPYYQRVFEYYQRIYDEEETRYLTNAKARLVALETRLAQ